MKEVSINADGFQEKVVEIMSDVYQNATQILNIVGVRTCKITVLEIEAS